MKCGIGLFLVVAKPRDLGATIIRADQVQINCSAVRHFRQEKQGWQEKRITPCPVNYVLMVAGANFRQPRNATIAPHPRTIGSTPTSTCAGLRPAASNDPATRGPTSEPTRPTATAAPVAGPRDAMS